jgi:hypothetical protein
VGDTQRFFTLSQQHLDELCAETSAAMSRRNGQAAEVTSPDTQVELAKPTKFSLLPDQGVGRETRQFRVSKEGLRRKRETEFRAAPNAAAVLGRKPRHYLRHVSFRHFDELYREIVQLKPHQFALQPRTRVTPPAPPPESRPRRHVETLVGVSPRPIWARSADPLKFGIFSYSMLHRYQF